MNWYFITYEDNSDIESLKRRVGDILRFLRKPPSVGEAGRLWNTDAWKGRRVGVGRGRETHKDPTWTKMFPKRAIISPLSTQRKYPFLLSASIWHGNCPSEIPSAKESISQGAKFPRETEAGHFPRRPIPRDTIFQGKSSSDSNILVASPVK